MTIKVTKKMMMVMAKALAGRCTVLFKPDVMRSSPVRGKDCVPFWLCTVEAEELMVNLTHFPIRRQLPNTKTSLFQTYFTIRTREKIISNYRGQEI